MNLNLLNFNFMANFIAKIEALYLVLLFVQYKSSLKEYGMGSP